MKIHILRDRDRYRVRCTDDDGKRTSSIHGTLKQAKAAASKLRRPSSVTVERALEQYRQHLQLKGLRPRTITTALERLEVVFTEPEASLDITPNAASSLWLRFCRPGAPR